MKVDRIVLDTNVIVSALRSREGASFLLLSLLGTGRFEVCITVPLMLEYEDAVSRSTWKDKPAEKVIDDILDYICQVAYKKEVFFLWRPKAKDPKDDMVLEAAMAGGCKYIITYNEKDLRPAGELGIGLLTPAEYLRQIGEIE